MRSTRFLGYAASLAVLVSFAAPVMGQKADDPNSAPNPYRLDEGWAKLPPGRKFGGVTAVEMDPDGKSVWFADRCGTLNDCSGSNLDPILKFDTSGKLVQSFGGGMFYYPHGLFIDRDHNVWVSDGRGKGGKGQIIVKFSPDGKVLMTIGKPGVAGDGPDTFNGPSDIVVAADGSIFVADGHNYGRNSPENPVARVMKLDRNGKFVKQWGKLGKGPGEFGELHGIAMDSAGRLFVADRGNNRIQIFDQDGKFLAQWRQFGSPSGITIDKHDIMYVADSHSTDTENPGFKQGVRFGSVKDGKVIGFLPHDDDLEGAAADDAGNLYTGLTEPMKVLRFVKK